MSVVEKRSPPWRPLAIAGGVIVVLSTVIALIVARDGGSRAPSTAEPSTTSSPSTRPSNARTRPIDVTFDQGASYRVYLQRQVTTGTMQVFAFIDTATARLRYVEDANLVLGSVVGGFGDRLMIEGARLRLVDRDFSSTGVAVEGDDFVGGVA